MFFDVASSRTIKFILYFFFFFSDRAAGNIMVPTSQHNHRKRVGAADSIADKKKKKSSQLLHSEFGDRGLVSGPRQCPHRSHLEAHCRLERWKFCLQNFALFAGT